MTSHIPTEYKLFLDGSIWPKDKIIASTNTPSQSGSGSNYYEEVTSTPGISRIGASL